MKVSEQILFSEAVERLALAGSNTTDVDYDRIFYARLSDSPGFHQLKVVNVELKQRVHRKALLRGVESPISILLVAEFRVLWSATLPPNMQAVHLWSLDDSISLRQAATFLNVISSHRPIPDALRALYDRSVWVHVRQVLNRAKDRTIGIPTWTLELP